MPVSSVAASDSSSSSPRASTVERALTGHPIRTTGAGVLVLAVVAALLLWRIPRLRALVKKVRRPRQF
jgi:hypothetical protein